jgi:hypothetical protein
VPDDDGSTERNELADGATVDDEFGPDPVQAANAHFDERVKQVDREQAAAEHLNILANAAMRGDKRVIVEG